MTELAPDYRILVAAAGRVNTDRVPLYDHIIAESVMEEILGLKFQVLLDGNDQDINEYFRLYCEFYRRMGYDTVSYEGVFTKILPGGGALINSSIAAIKDRQDFDKYPFSELETLYYQAYDRCFRALRHNLPRGMKAVGGIGNGVFECVQDLTGYQRLCYMIADDPELYEAMFSRVGAVLLHSWERLLAVYGDVFCVGRFGDDLGFRTATLLSHDDICKLIVPCYRRIIDAVHAAGKPFLLHSCGNIFGVMDDLIDTAHIDAKHSNEDEISPFSTWVRRYGDRIALFGGIDTDKLCRLDAASLRDYIQNVFDACAGCTGWAFGSGNSIPDYVPTEQYLIMNETARRLRSLHGGKVRE